MNTYESDTEDAARYQHLREIPRAPAPGMVWVAIYRALPGDVPEVAAAGHGNSLDAMVDAAIFADTGVALESGPAGDAERYRYLREVRDSCDRDGSVWVATLQRGRGGALEVVAAGFGKALDRAVDSARERRAA
jgi:type III secretion system FlhB-like substrate exporter